MTSAEETAKYVQMSAELTGDVELLAVQAWNETTPWKFVQIGFHIIGAENGFPLNTLIQPTIRIPCSFAGNLKIKRIRNLYATFRDVVAGDELVMRWAIL